MNWIAKPIHELSIEDRLNWNRIQADRYKEGWEIPLAQTLAWAEASQTLGARAYALFNSERRYTAIILAKANTQKTGIEFECVNGPLINWDTFDTAQEFAVLAQKISELHPRFESLSFLPRWLEENHLIRRSRIPFEIFQSMRASTLLLKLPTSTEEVTKLYSSRLQRTVTRSKREPHLTYDWREVNPQEIAEFAPRMAYFGKKMGFAIPPVSWFLSLHQATHRDTSLRLYLASVESSRAGAHHCIATWQNQAHYLFGHSWRESPCPAAFSPAALAHDLSLRQLIQIGITEYDLNGDSNERHYATVHEFKSQFNAERINYWIPEFRISKNT